MKRATQKLTLRNPSRASCSQLLLALFLGPRSSEVCISVVSGCSIDLWLIYLHKCFRCKPPVCVHSVYRCLDPTFCNVPSAKVTAFLTDGIIFLLFLVQRKSVLARKDWTEKSKGRQRKWWFCRTAQVLEVWQGRSTMTLFTI